MFEVYFFATPAGNEPALEFIKTFEKPERVIIGENLKTVQFGWPIGMPICSPLGDGIYEVRTSLSSKREVRILFFQHGDVIVVVHAFLKKTQKTPKADKDIALARKREFENNVRASAKSKPRSNPKPKSQANDK